MHASIPAIEYYLPDMSITTAQLSAIFPEWGVEKIEAKTGIRCRHISADSECASDLAYKAAEKLFASGACDRKAVDFVITCTQSPDYVLPATACLLQDRLGIPTSVGALDVNLGCSGFLYGLGLAEGLISSGQASHVLLITADTITKYIDESDKTTRTIFGDGAAATLLVRDVNASLGPFIYGTDGRGGPYIICPNSGARRSDGKKELSGTPLDSPAKRDRLFMDGPRVFDFVLSEVPKCVQELLSKSRVELDAIDLFVFHQANQYMLDELRRIIGVPREKFQLTLSHCGNTVSSAIPIALKHAEMEGRLTSDSLTMIVAFGVGYSWGATLLRR